MILIIVAWLYYFMLAFTFGVGVLKLVQRYTGGSNRLTTDVFYTFLFGYIFLVAVLQIFSLFLPLNSVVFVVVMLAGVLFAAYNYKAALRALQLLWQKLVTWQGALSFVIISLMLLILAYSANREIAHGDTFLYHFNAVKWVKEFSVVPGLANLHSRLGFNSSFFLFAAFTDIGVYANQSGHIAVSLLMAVCAIHWFTIIVDQQQPMPKRIFCMLTFSYLLIHSFWIADINSLSTDYPTAILCFEFCLILLDNNFKPKVMLLLPLAALILTFKLSGMLAVGFGFLLFAGSCIQWWFDANSKKENGRILISSLLFFGVVVIGFVVRNAFVSGWLIFPFPIGNLHLPWSVPREYVIDTIDWIKSYPKIPGGASPTTIKGNDFLFWFIPWFGEFRKTIDFDLFCVACILTACSFFNVKSVSKFYYARPHLLLLILFSIASILFWFSSAPEMRFGSVYFYIFFSSSAILFYESSQLRNGIVKLIFVGFIFLFLKEVRWFVLDRTPTLFTFTYTKPLDLKRVIASPPGEKPELYIYMPAEGDACGNSPLPCTPYADGFVHEKRVLGQRVPGDISKGFLPIPR